MNEIRKFALVSKSGTGAVPETEAMAKINALTLRALAPEDVFVFRVAACDDRIDRDHERFSPEALGEMAALFLGRAMLFDHAWTSKHQTARIFDAVVEKNGEVSRLVLSLYMLRTPATEDVITAIDGGILKEVSVAVCCREALCSICGADKSKTWCEHLPGAEYGGQVCHVVLNHVTDAYELSFVAVPAQREAGVIKAYGGEDHRPAPAGAEQERLRALALLELEAL